MRSDFEIEGSARDNSPVFGDALPLGGPVSNFTFKPGQLNAFVPTIRVDARHVYAYRTQSDQTLNASLGAEWASCTCRIEDFGTVDDAQQNIANIADRIKRMALIGTRDQKLHAWLAVWEAELLRRDQETFGRGITGV
jgi:hypothetical protein